MPKLLLGFSFNVLPIVLSTYFLASFLHWFFSTNLPPLTQLSYKFLGDSWA
jgi:hypothetical protein